MKPVHVEARTVCGDGGIGPGPVFCNEQLDAAFSGDVHVYEWVYDASQIQRATCEQCLLAVFMLGDSARIALERMGMKVEVRDVPSEIS